MRQWWIGRTAAGFDKWLTAKHPEEQECRNCFITSDGSEECVEYIPVQEILPDTITLTRQEFQAAYNEAIDEDDSGLGFRWRIERELFGEEK